MEGPFQPRRSGILNVSLSDAKIVPLISLEGDR